MGDNHRSGHGHLIIAVIIMTAFIAVSSVSLICTSDGTDASGGFTADGINYGIVSGTEVSVVSGSYEGSVVIPSSVSHSGKTYCVTAIDDKAFASNNDLTSVSIPSTVLSIGDEVFRDCISLMEMFVDIDNPEYLSYDGILFSKGMDVLIQYPLGRADESFTVPDGVRTIADDSFFGANYLRKVIIGKDVTSIGEYAFAMCVSMKEFQVDGANQCYCSDDGVLFDKGMTKLISYPSTKEETDLYTVPITVTVICDMAFYSAQADNLFIGKNVVSIGHNAFKSMLLLRNITVDGDNPVYSSKEGVLFNKDMTVLILHPRMNIGLDYEVPDTVTAIADYAFYMSALGKVILPEGLRTIGDHAFYESALDEMSLPDSVISVGDHAFDECSSMTSLRIGSGLTSLGDNEFIQCMNLKRITVSEDNQYYSSENGVLFDKSGTVLLKYPSAKEGDSYTVPGTVVSIGDNAFCSCPSLSSVVITNGVVSVGAYSFAKCINLTSVTIGTSVSIIGECAFYNTKITDVTIPASVTSIGDQAFYCKSLASISVDSGNMNYCSVSGVLFNKDMTSLVIYPVSKSDTAYTIPSTVVSVCDNAFQFCSGLTSVIIPEGVAYIGNSAFRNCTGLISVSIPSSVVTIGNMAFYQCRGVSEFTVDSGNMNYCSVSGVLFDRDMTTLMYYPMNKEGTSYTVPDTVIVIGDRAFYYSKVESVVIPDSVRVIGTEAFVHSLVISLIIPEGTVSIDNSAFKNCIYLESMTLPESLHYIGKTVMSNSGNCSVYVRGMSPISLGYQAFGTVSVAPTLYVPYDSIGSYEAKWSMYSDKMRPYVDVPEAEYLVYNGTLQTGIVQKQGAYTVTGNTAVDAGAYTAMVTPEKDVYWSDGKQDARSVQWRIMQKSVLVKADDVTKGHGYRDPELTATVTGLIGDDKVVYTLSREGGEDVGTYRITPSGDGSQGNYSVAYQTGTFTIKGSQFTDSSVIWVIPIVLVAFIALAVLFWSVKKD